MKLTFGTEYLAGGGHSSNIFFGDVAFHDTYTSGAYLKVKCDKVSSRLCVDKISANSAGLLGWFYYDYASQNWWDCYVTNDSYHLMNGWFLSSVSNYQFTFNKSGMPGYYWVSFSQEPRGDCSDA
ncbi:MAG: hypothetical protein HY912_04855 [Desulfomonile tiedjei]|uniref:Uncharacterized protein n=1 Tax=Desulfomonile tiedjei TaxID=2358 RepID=A0A9D6YZH1_9BACT|nr:hypothetical protein [Desulfomonile tiedjei]